MSKSRSPRSVVLVGIAALVLSALISGCGDDDGSASPSAAVSTGAAVSTTGHSSSTSVTTTTATVPEPSPITVDMSTDPPRDPLRGDPAAGHPLLPDATTIEYQPGLYLYLDEPDTCDENRNITIVTSHPRLAEGFAARGVAVALTEVRNPGRAGSEINAENLAAFQYAVHDLGVAVQWLHAHAAEHCVDPDAIVATGYSFSAIAALSLAYTVGELDPGTDITVEELGGAARTGPDTLSAPPELADYSNQIDAAVSFSGFALADTIEPGEPPALLFHGRNDGTIPFALAEQTCAAATTAGIDCELVAHDSGHGIADDLDAALDHAMDFLQRHVTSPEPTTTNRP